MMPPIKMLDISQVKLRDSSKSKSFKSSPTSSDGGKPIWLAELSRKQANRKSADVIEELKKETGQFENRGIGSITSGPGIKPKPPSFKQTKCEKNYSSFSLIYCLMFRNDNNGNIGWDKKILDTNQNFVDKEEKNLTKLSEVSHHKYIMSEGALAKRKSKVFLTE